MNYERSVQEAPPGWRKFGIEDLERLPHSVRDHEMRFVPDLDRRVYAVARTIACGATRSYGEIAVELGERGLARDVGQALGRNPFPLVVPCHRVIREDGNLAGYRWGLTRKEQLLATERAAAK